MIVRNPGNGKDFGKLSGRIIDSDMHDVGRFLNRLLGPPPEIQNRLFELFVSILDLLIENARIEGSLDTGILDLRGNVVELQGTPKTVHVDHLTRASTVLFTFILDRGIKWESANSMLDEKQKDGLGSANDGFYESKREWLGRRHFILAFERDMNLAELKSKYRKVLSLEKAQTGWEEEYEVSSKQVWDAIKFLDAINGLHQSSSWVACTLVRLFLVPLSMVWHEQI